MTIRALHPLRAAVLLAALALGASCGGETPVTPDQPVPGTLAVSLNTPYADDKGLVIELVGRPGAVTALQAASGLELHSAAVTGGFRIAVFGAIADGTLLTFHVPDVRDVAQYTATLVEAAGPNAALRPASPAYGVGVVAPVVP